MIDRRVTTKELLLYMACVSVVCSCGVAMQRAIDTETIPPPEFSIIFQIATICLAFGLIGGPIGLALVGRVGFLTGVIIGVCIAASVLVPIINRLGLFID